MGKKSRRKQKEFAIACFFRVVAWVCLIWVVCLFVVANSPLEKTVPPITHTKMEKELTAAEKAGGKLAPVQRMRAKLITEYLGSNDLVKARTQLLTYRNWLDTNPNFSLAERIEMHQELAKFHTLLSEYKLAIAQYDMIMHELAAFNAPDSEVLKARFLNNRGVANYLLSQTSEQDDLRKKYLASSIDDFRASQDLIAAAQDHSKKAATPANKNLLGYLDQIVRDNEETLDRDMQFTPVELQP
jgi:hypothetical protein